MKKPTTTAFKIQSHRALRDEIMAVARGERPAPRDAGRQSFESASAIMHLLTRENRQLLATIKEHKPDSVSALVQMTGRSQPSLTRTLAKFAAMGLVRFEKIGRRKAPRSTIKKIVVEIDPYSERDRLRVA